MHAVVVGAGPVGCLAAASLARAGFRVSVIERRDGVVDPGHRKGRRTIGLSISPRGMQALQDLGCGEAVQSRSLRMDHRVLHLCGNEPRNMAYGPGRWNYAISRRDLNEVLLNHLGTNPGVTVQFRATCQNIDPEQRTILVGTSGNTQIQMAYDLLIGADGASSVVRAELAARQQLAVQSTVLPSAYKELTLGPGAPPHCRSAIHIWPREGFFLVGLPNRAGEFTGTLVMPEQGSPGFDQIAEFQSARAFMERNFPDAAMDWDRFAQEFANNAVSRITTVTCSAMHYGDSVLLVGDAAHTIAPFLGQGINLGFEDCQVLQRHLDRHGTLFTKALDAYTEDRKGNADAAAALSMRNYSELSTGVRQQTDIVSLVNFAGLAYRTVLEHVMNRSEGYHGNS